eukprot:316571_1
MVHAYGSHLLSLIYNPLHQHLKPYEDTKHKLLRSGSILQMAKLYDMSENHRSMMDAEWKAKETLYDILKDRDDDNNLDINIIQNTLITLQEMAHHNKYNSILKYCNITTKIQVIIIDKLLIIISNKSE